MSRFRRPVSKGKYRSKRKRHKAERAINHAPSAIMRGGIRL